MNRVIVIDNPLAQYLLARIRDKNTPPSTFRKILEDLGFILGYEISRLLKWDKIVVETPLAETTGIKPKEKLYIIGILGACIPLVQGMLKALPWAGLGLVAARRIEKEESIEIEVYYKRLLEDLSSYKVVIADPMLATGYTISTTIELLKEHKARDIIISSVISSKQGVDYLLEKYPDIRIVTIAIDPVLNSKWFIVPGLGDAGDRALNPDYL